MIQSNPEVTKIYRLAVPIGENITVYLVPLVHLLILYAAWRVRRLNFDLLCAILCIAFLLIVLMTPAAPGWFVWVLPLLVIYQARSDRIARALVCLFSFLYLGTSLLAEYAAEFAGDVDRCSTDKHAATRPLHTAYHPGGNGPGVGRQNLAGGSEPE